MKNLRRASMLPCSFQRAKQEKHYRIDSISKLYHKGKEIFLMDFFQKLSNN